MEKTSQKMFNTFGLEERIYSVVLPYLKSIDAYSDGQYFLDIGDIQPFMEEIANSHGIYNTIIKQLSSLQVTIIVCKGCYGGSSNVERGGDFYAPIITINITRDAIINENQEERIKDTISHEVQHIIKNMLIWKFVQKKIPIDAKKDPIGYMMQDTEQQAYSAAIATSIMRVTKNKYLGIIKQNPEKIDSIIHGLRNISGKNLSIPIVKRIEKIIDVMKKKHVNLDDKKLEIVKSRLIKNSIKNLIPLLIDFVYELENQV